jgi:regulatory protein
VRPGDEQPPGDPEQELGDPESVARVICLRLLTQRARSRAELAAALRKRGVPDAAARTVLDRLADVGLIDDAALAAQVAAAQHAERGLARRAVAAKLRRRGLESHSDTALVALDASSERARARQLVQQRRQMMAGLPPEVQARRLVGLLGRKGYSAGLAYSVVREALASEPGWDATALDGGDDA